MGTNFAIVCPNAHAKNEFYALQCFDILIELVSERYEYSQTMPVESVGDASCFTWTELSWWIIVTELSILLQRFTL